MYIRDNLYLWQFLLLHVWKMSLKLIKNEEAHDAFPEEEEKSGLTSALPQLVSRFTRSIKLSNKYIVYIAFFFTFGWIMHLQSFCICNQPDWPKGSSNGQFFCMMFYNVHIRACHLPYALKQPLMGDRDHWSQFLQPMPEMHWK